MTGQSLLVGGKPRRFPCSSLLGVTVAALLAASSGLGAQDGLTHTFGAGFGIPYGLLGVNYEMELHLSDSFTLGPSAGVGSTLLAGVGWNVGFRAHFLSKEKLFRPGLSAWFGTNTLVEETGGWGDSEDYETRTGVTLGAEGRFQFGSARRHCLDVFLLYVVSPHLDDDDYEEEGSPVKVGVGYALRL